MATRPVILHLSNDYPDPLLPNKTVAVKALVEGTAAEFRHIVYSLNRIDGWAGILSAPFGEDRTMIAYKALPKGFFWEERLKDVADWIEKDLRSKNIIPDLIEAHKFTVEGLIGEQLARAFSKPLICDIQGDTDEKILTKKPGLRKRYKEIAQRAAIVFPYAPWPLKTFQELTGLDVGKCRLLPVVPGFDTLTSSEVTAENRLITVFNADSWKRKNIDGVVRAIKKLVPVFPDISLDIYGRGKPASIKKINHIISGAGLKGRVSFKGPADNATLPELMGKYAGFVLPSKRESYGLVYAEALFSGIPVLFSKDRGIDGYFDTPSIGYAANPHSVGDISKGIEYILTNQAHLKSSIAGLQSNGGLDLIRQASIYKTYTEGLYAALAS